MDNLRYEDTYCARLSNGCDVEINAVNFSGGHAILIALYGKWISSSMYIGFSRHGNQNRLYTQSLVVKTIAYPLTHQPPRVDLDRKDNMLWRILIGLLGMDQFIICSFVYSSDMSCKTHNVVVKSKDYLIHRDIGSLQPSINYDYTISSEILNPLIQQTEINERMRSILVDWLTGVHFALALSHESLWLSVEILDRYMTKSEVKKVDYQLLGATTLIIAAKLEDGFGHLNAIVVPNVFTVDDMLKTEKLILKTLDFHLYYPTVYHFLATYLDIINASSMIRSFALYYAERYLQEYESLSYPKSHVAAAALYASAIRNDLPNEPLGVVMPSTTGVNGILWPKALFEESGLEPKDILPIALDMISKGAEKPALCDLGHLLVETQNKYASHMYQYVSILAMTQPH
eukprot:gene3303-6540_t